LDLLHWPIHRDRGSRCRPYGLLAVGLAVVLLGRGTPARANITITPTFESNITTDPNATAIEGAINAAITAVEANISSPHNITVSLDFQETSSGLGGSSNALYGVYYYDYYNLLKAVATSPAQLAAIASLGTAPTSTSSGNPVNGNNELYITAAEGRNLGFNTPAATQNGGTGPKYDTVISLNTLITSPPGTLNGSTYSLQAVAAHEIDEALGIGGTGSTLTANGSISGAGVLTGPIGDLDLFRYSAAGVRSYTNSTSATSYLSSDGGTTSIAGFNQTGTGDYADWNSASLRVQNAFGTPGATVSLGTAELTALNIIGYDMTGAPEPEALTMMGSIALGLSAYALRYRKRRAAEPRTA